MAAWHTCPDNTSLHQLLNSHSQSTGGIAHVIDELSRSAKPADTNMLAGLINTEKATADEVGSQWAPTAGRHPNYCGGPRVVGGGLVKLFPQTCLILSHNTSATACGCWYAALLQLFGGSTCRRAARIWRPIFFLIARLGVKEHRRIARV